MLPVCCNGGHYKDNEELKCLLMKVLSNPRYGNSKCCIVGNRTLLFLSSFEMLLFVFSKWLRVYTFIRDYQDSHMGEIFTWRQIKRDKTRWTGHCTWSKPCDARLQRFKIKCKSYSFPKILVIFTFTNKVLWKSKETTNQFLLSLTTSKLQNATGKYILICGFLS